MTTTGTIAGTARIKGVEMNKKLSTYLVVGVIAVALVSYGIAKMDDLQPVSFGLGGGSHGVTLNAELPEAPETMPYYRVVNEEFDDAMSPEFGREQKFIPSEEEAVRIAEEYIESHGGMPDDAVFGDVRTSYWMKIHSSGEVVEKRPECIQVGYHRVFNGMPVAGPGDKIMIAIGNNGTVLSFLKSWRKLEYAGEREILNANEAVERLQRGETIYKLGGPLHTIEIDRIELGYYSDVPGRRQEFYEPVWVFHGKRIEGDNVPALPVWAGVTMPPPIPYQRDIHISHRRLE